MANHPAPSDPVQLVAARRREIAIEHLLFGTIRFVAKQHPELVEELDASVDHLWDLSDETPRDDEAVRDIARTFLKSLRASS